VSLPTQTEPEQMPPQRRPPRRRRPPAPTRTARRRWLLGAELLIVAVVAAVILAIVLSGGRSGHGTRGSRPGTPPTAPRPTAAPPVFAANSVWNEPVPANAPLLPQSSTYVGELQQEMQGHGEWINTNQYSIPVYTVGANQPLVPVRLDQSAPGSVDALARTFAAGVPIPAGAHAAAGTDQSLVIWQPSRNVEWEFWRAHQVNGVWHAYWGGKMTDVSGNPGYFTSPSDWGGSATSLDLLGGLMTFSDLRSGHIDHALAMAIPTSAQGRFVYPAQRGDGHDSSPSAIPEGTRFRLNPNLNIDALHLPPLTRMMALAAQRYGIIVRDQAGSISFYGQDPTPTGTDPYSGPHGLFDGLAPDKLLQAFPWSQLQVVDPSWNRH
jgi:hypothetical protein